MESKRKEWLDKMKERRASKEASSDKGTRSERGTGDARKRAEARNTKAPSDFKSKWKANLEKVRARRKAAVKKTD